MGGLTLAHNGWRYGLVKADHYRPIEEQTQIQPLLTIPLVINMCCKLNSMVSMTKPKLLIKLSVEHSIVGDKDVNRLPYVSPELGEFATLFITADNNRQGGGKCTALSLDDKLY